MSSDWHAIKNRGVHINDFGEPDPVYKWLGTTVTGVQDPLYPWHFDDVVTIRRMIGNDFIPVTRRMVYQGPSGGELVFVHLGVAVYDENKSPEEQLQGILMPTWAPWPRPNRIGLWFEPAQKRAYGLPGRTVAWGDWVVQMAREAKVLSAKEALLRAKRARENAEANSEYKHALQESAYKQREEARYQKKIVSSMSSSELDEFGSTMNGSYVPEPETKPFVYVKQG